MKKMNCNIANDLIPLYIDDVISKDSKEMLEEHIIKCKQCQQTIEKMKQDIPMVEERNINPFKKIRKKLVVRSIIIALLLILILGFWVFCQMTWLPVHYVGETLMNDMEVLDTEDGLYLYRDELSARGDIIIVEDHLGVLKFYIGESIPNRFRLAWWSRPHYTKIAEEVPPVGSQEITQVAYCDPDGNILYVLWEKDADVEE
ncbi:MAG: zf-HC2 domain-containing protein [Lachnospiraceae bacterium]|nr:zf-HC2 domain-containing protein [Lachnospiraceae bacterium]